MSMQNQIFQTASDIAYNIISQKILDGEFGPGMRLSRRKMAELTKVSVIPVIEALKRLEEDGLLESKPQWGSFVTIPDKKKVIQIYQVREAIECMVARILSGTLTQGQIGRLKAIATELDTAPYDDQHVEFSRKNHMIFHSCLVEFTENQMLVRTLNRINLLWVLYKAQGASAAKLEYPRYWHRKLLDEIMSGNPDRAEAAMREHILDSLGPILEKMGDE